jgi:hypothetical protein
MTNSATYSPEDNKLRLYVGRVPRDEYERLRAEGWTSTPKQSCDFVATWTPQRRDTALEYADLIEDEDQGPEDRAADRAERFGEYRDKRAGEAVGFADRYESGPTAHGYQNERRAERAARRHDRIGSHAVDAWGKADYWQRRTAGVISHALHVSSPGVRMGRIKTIEAELRGIEKTRAENAQRFETWRKIAAMTDADKQTEIAERFAGIGYGKDGYKHPRTGAKGSLWDFLRKDATDRLTGAEAAALYLASHTDPLSPAWNETRLADWAKHCQLRLAYENQMLEAQGGRAAFVEMQVGGWIGKHQIRKVNKSNATGRVVSVTLHMEGNRWGNEAKPGEYYTRACNVERLPADAYRPPTAEDIAALTDTKAAEKAAAPKKPDCPLINPTDADAVRLQAIWNAQRERFSDNEEKQVARMTQAQYSNLSKGTYSRAEAKALAAGGLEPASRYGYALEPAVCKVRFFSRSVIILTDKPQKPLPAEAFESPRAAQLAIVQDSIDELQDIDGLLRGSMKNESDLLSAEQRELFRLAQLVGYAYNSSLSQRGFTDKGYAFLRERQQPAGNPVIAALVAASESFA